ncbi:hypothetical protein [Halobellus inordinatus]|uniref:hypothetical protein n=1 Tax=Halobellus inordinatus TaxID=1126236 RepID=UPI00210BA6BD|nr:hypothetical protein [Halobellus inordinatus]
MKLLIAALNGRSPPPTAASASAAVDRSRHPSAVRSQILESLFIRAEGDIGDSGSDKGTAGGASGNLPGGGGDGDGDGGSGVSLPGNFGSVWSDLEVFVNNPRRFVLGVLLSTLVGYVLTALLLGINLTRWIAGFEVPGQITVDGSSVNVPWCSSNECDLFSFVDIPGYVADVLIDEFGLGGIQLLQGIETVWTSIPSDGGLAGPAILFLLGLGMTVGLFWLVRIIIAAAPVSRP